MWWLRCALAVGVAVLVVCSRRCVAQTGDDVIGQLSLVFCLSLTALRPSVRLSVRLSVKIMYCD